MTTNKAQANRLKRYFGTISSTAHQSIDDFFELPLSGGFFVSRETRFSRYRKRHLQSETNRTNHFFLRVHGRNFEITEKKHWSCEFRRATIYPPPQNTSSGITSKVSPRIASCAVHGHEPRGGDGHFRRFEVSRLPSRRWENCSLPTTDHALDIIRKKIALFHQKESKQRGGRFLFDRRCHPADCLQASQSHCE